MNPNKLGEDIMCLGSVERSCSTYGTSHVAYSDKSKSNTYSQVTVNECRNRKTFKQFCQHYGWKKTFFINQFCD